ncbi:Isopentenyl phosphate kinase [Candidatus Methanobinarius endosymbioticus]|uniref:Isopentenyl phosphate kinase n=1 Tax=Candidatus Methanobinarius endosymbioticus TaxID=2006182 RepID=A0A366MAI6_9EURY|nr:Isopentenyl phosphate kinase [Candidatus Methanobinarius endosymbioticus]
MIILKIGGSILTNKNSKKAEVNYTNLNRIAKEIKNALETLNDGGNANINTNLSSDNFDEYSKNSFNHDLVIIHGAGSFGHPPAKKYNIGQKFSLEEYLKKRIGFSKTQNCVKKLNTAICDIFIEKGLPCVSIPPSAIITTKNKRIKTFDIDIIKRYIKEGFIPVIYGDVVLDDDLKVAVLSGDQILQYIAKNISNNDNKYDKKEVILGTDVNGVFTKNPKKYDDAKHISKLSSLDEIEMFDSTTNIDVTGGMIGKIKELLELAEIGIESKIINANEPDAIFNALNNKKIKGTIIK